MSDIQRFINIIKNIEFPEALSDRLYWCRIILKEYHSLDLPELYATEWLVALDSETDHFPVAEQRKLYNKESLEKLDKELIDTYEKDLLELFEIRRKLIEELNQLLAN